VRQHDVAVTHLYEAEPYVDESFDCFCIVVTARSKSEWVWEIQAERFYKERLLIRHAWNPSRARARFV
jgi:hypothetical protein